MTLSAKRTPTEYNLVNYSPPLQQRLQETIHRKPTDTGRDPKHTPLNPKLVATKNCSTSNTAAMSLAHNQTGIIIASISAAIFVVLCLGIVLLKGNLPFTYSRRTPRSTEQDIEAHRAGTSIRTSTSGEYEQYGELFISPDRQPTVVALDVMTRMLVVTGLPATASVPNPSRLSLCLNEAPVAAELPRICLTGPDRDSLNTLDTVDIPVVTVAKARRARRSKAKVPYVPEDIRIATGQPDAAQIGSDEPVDAAQNGVHKVGEENAEQVMIDPMSFSFGSGKGMAGLYRD